MEEWKKLSPEYHKLFQEAAGEVVTWSRAHTVKETEKSYEKLRQKKEVKEIFFLPKPEQKKLTSLVTPAMKRYIGKRIGGKIANKLLLLLESTRWHSVVPNI
jgi:TRAP-type C4-dicarboxylate transport system substrate-binding protein